MSGPHGGDACRDAGDTGARLPPRRRDRAPPLRPPPSRPQLRKSAAPPAKPAAPAAAGEPVFPTAVSPKYSTETAGKARMHTCLDQYNENKAGNGNGGLNWIQKGGGYYSECNKRLKG